MLKVAVLLAAMLAPLWAPIADATASPGYPNVSFSDGFESGSLSAWSRSAGNGSASVTAAAGKDSSYGLHLSNSAGQFELASKSLPSPIVDSSTSFWMRVNSPASSGFSGSGIEDVAEARSESGHSTQWQLLYDSNAQGFWLEAYTGSSSIEVFTGAGSAPLATWIQVEVRYTATSTGGLQLLLNGQSQPDWTLHGDYTRAENFQQVQLWDDAANSTDFDNLAVSTPGTPSSPPVNAAPPATTGIAHVGQPITTSDGNWSGSPTSYAYAYQQCDPLGSNCNPIAGAQSSAYTLQASDLGHTIRSVVTASNAAGSASSSSAPTAVVQLADPSGPPASTAAPTITGQLVSGQALSADPGAWTNRPSAYGYRWQDCSAAGCVDINGATSNSYTLQPSDVGQTIDVIVTAVNGLGSASATSAQTTAVAGPTGTVAPMSVVSRNQPVYGQGTVVYPPEGGVDASYGGGSEYRCSAPCALVVDLSAVPAAQRQRAVVSWYNDDTSYYAASIGGPYYNEPRDYTIDVSTAPASGGPPASGWTTLAGVTGNFLNGREHLVDLAGANWVRMRVTGVNGSPGNTDAAFNFDVADASAGSNDTWLILGDSITQDDMGHYEPTNFMQQVNAAYADHFPSQINGGIGGWDSSSPLQVDPLTGVHYIDEFLSSFPGHFVALDYGTNDANQGGQLVADYASNMTALINKVIAAGKVPVLRRSIPWGCTDGIRTNGPAINAALAALHKQFPQAVAGPDEWSYFQAHPSLISSDCIHPTLYDGASAYRQVYVQSLLGSVYAH